MRQKMKRGWLGQSGLVRIFEKENPFHLFCRVTRVFVFTAQYRCCHGRASFPFSSFKFSFKNFVIKV